MDMPELDLDATPKPDDVLLLIEVAESKMRSGDLPRPQG
jgi:hypothetical protein